MIRYIRYFVCSILLCFPYLTFGKVFCNSENYSASLDIEKENLSINETVNINITSDFDYKVEYKTNNKEIIKINEDGVITPLKQGSTKVSAIISFYEEDNKVSECTSILDINILSNDSSLKSLTLEELDISSDFDKDKLEYDITLPYNYEKINIIAEPNEESATITGDGRRYLNEGNNVYDIVVKASDGSTTTYKINIIREAANDDNTLSNLIVEGYELYPEFSKDVFEYSLNVDETIEEITINAIPNYEFSKVTGTGTFKIATGENRFFVIVTAENDTEEEYEIIINKNKGNSKLNNLIVNGHKLDKKFTSDEFIYNLTVKNNIEKLDIKAESNDNEKIEIIGNENLQIGTNNIIIRVSGENKGATTYKLVVTKLSIEEEEKNDLLLKILLVIFVVSIIIMITLILIFLKRNYKRNSKKIKINNNLKNKKK